MDSKRKDSLRLKYWDYRLPGPYFVTICVFNKRIIFSEDSMRNSIAQIINVAGEKLFVHVHCFVISADHIHLLVGLPENKTVSLFKVVALIKVRITQYIVKSAQLVDKMVGAANTIWQRSYYEHVIRDEKDFLQKAEYIENHPFKEVGTHYAEWH